MRNLTAQFEISRNHDFKVTIYVRIKLWCSKFLYSVRYKLLSFLKPDLFWSKPQCLGSAPENDWTRVKRKDTHFV